MKDETKDMIIVRTKEEMSRLLQAMEDTSQNFKWRTGSSPTSVHHFFGNNSSISGVCIRRKTWMEG